MKTVFPPLPAGPIAALEGPPRICIVSSEFVGLFKNGGIGTAYTSMAEALAGAGCSVTCLYVGQPPASAPDLDRWVTAYRARHVTLATLPPPGLRLISRGPDFATSYAIYRWFKEHDDFDVIHFPEYLGHGYHTLQAKHQGIFRGRAKICVGVHSMTRWLKTANQEHLTELCDLERDFMERESVALADVVVSPSQYLLNWIVGRNWQLPAQAYVQPYILPRSARLSKAPATTPMALGELVFFGRLETRKGVKLFCDALDRIPAELGRKISRVTFLGREGVVNGLQADAFVRQRAKSWPFAIQLLRNLDQPDAIAYLRAPGRLAVIPSLMENSPNTVYECLGAGIAFIASRVGGIPELIEPRGVDAVCFEPTPRALAEKLCGALVDGLRPSAAAIDAEANERAWIDWHRHAATEVRRPVVASTPATPAAWPKVTLALVTFNRPDLLRQALESVEKIDYPDFEVVLVDDGSTQPDAVAMLQNLEPAFARRGWRVVRQENRYLGAARNQAARHASGEYILFMDDDNYAEPSELKTLVGIAERTRADIVGCGMNIFRGLGPPNLDQPAVEGWLPLGGLPALGAFDNCFSDANALIRRSCFESLGGFTEDYGVTHEDWEFHARAVLGGFKLTVVPEFLFWYRSNSASMLRSTPRYLNSMRNIRPYLAAVPENLRDIISVAQGWYERELKASTTGGEISAYAALTIRWRSKFEAGSILAAMNHREEAVRLMVDAVKSVQSSRHALVILEAMLTVGEGLRPLDRKRAATLAELAVDFAKHSPNGEHQCKAKLLLESCLPHAALPRSPSTQPQAAATAIAVGV